MREERKRKKPKWIRRDNPENGWASESE